MKRILIFFLLLIFSFFNPLSLQGAVKKTKSDGNQLSDEKITNSNRYKFPFPNSLKPNVEFWKLIYSKYDKNQIVFHDTENLQIIYSVVDITDLSHQYLPESKQFALAKKERLQAEKLRIQSILKKLSATEEDPKNLNLEEKRIYQLFEPVKNRSEFAEALKPGRLRTQTGQKDKFVKAIEQSGAYLPEIEKIFAEHGLPNDLTRLPFVESMFNNDARSKVGASGIWQFMPGTGRLFMKVNSVVDERNDPIQATRAAAHLLKSNYDELQSWPLAVNAYNSGMITLARAKAELGTDDIGEITSRYRSRTYQFASRNFYSEFLAALEVANHYKSYFGDIKRLPPFQYDLFTVGTPAPLSTLAESAGISIATLEEMNPAYSSSFFSSNKTFPAGYTIKIPLGTKDEFEKGMERVALKRVGTTPHKISESGYPQKKKFAKLKTSKKKSISMKKEIHHSAEVGQVE